MVRVKRTLKAFPDLNKTFRVTVFLDVVLHVKQSLFMTHVAVKWSICQVSKANSINLRRILN